MLIMKHFKIIWLFIIAVSSMTLSCNTAAGEHLTSYYKVYGINAAPNSENYKIFNVPENTEIDGWLSFHVDLFPVDDEFKSLYVRISIRNAENGQIYYYGFVKPGESKDYVFPTMVHSFHPLFIEIKCINNYDTWVPCTGYYIFYGK